MTKTRSYGIMVSRNPIEQNVLLPMMDPLALAVRTKRKSTELARTKLKANPIRPMCRSCECCSLRLFVSLLISLSCMAREVYSGGNPPLLASDWFHFQTVERRAKKYVRTKAYFYVVRSRLTSRDRKNKK
jgi:hypothetical protein